LDYLAAVWGN